MSHTPEIHPHRVPVVLAILDGVGIGSGERDDAVHAADTPTLDRWRQTVPFIALRAAGTAVGLPSDDDMGNSEVGHNAMGAGRIFSQGATLVNEALASGSAFESDTWKQLVSCPTVHFLGLISDGNVHSHVDHLYVLIRQAVKDGVRRIRIHGLTDGRDVAARSALHWFEPLEDYLAELREKGIDARMASGGGRMQITMDRYEADWEMVRRGWDAHVHGKGQPFASASEAIHHFYREDATRDDQWLPAFVIVDELGEPVGRIEDGHGVLMFNFRGDRAIEISRAFEEPDLHRFERGVIPEVFYAGMMEYDGDLHVPKHYLVAPPNITRTVGDALAEAGRSTFACSETQKFGHVTFFFNGNRSGKISDELETYVEVPSDNVPFNQRPAMKAAEITEAALEAIASGRYDHIRLNYANGDMVGHTGDLEATKTAMEVVDAQMAILEKAVEKAGGVMIVTADHGNADEMFMRKKGKVLTDDHGVPLPRTSHSLNLVPCYLVNAPEWWAFRDDIEDPGIGSIGGTILQLLGVPLPADYLPGLITTH